MKKVWYDQAWADYLSWHASDKKTFKKINTLIKAIERTPYEGEGKPEPLKYEFSGWWSRRIDSKNRIVYRIKENSVEILSCKGHYES